jgi:hypothetical protein
VYFKIDEDCPMLTAKGELLKFNNNKGVKIGIGKRSTL